MDPLINCLVFFLFSTSVLYSLFAPNLRAEKLLTAFPEVTLKPFQISPSYSTRVYAYKRVLSLRRTLESVVQDTTQSIFDVHIDGGHPLRVYELSKSFEKRKCRVRKNRVNVGVPEVSSSPAHL